MKHSGEMPYYCGTDFAMDFLALKDNEWAAPYDIEDACLSRDYSVLSVGCGDIRSLVLTVAEVPERFTGRLNIVMCDFDPFVMARNVLFLFMMTSCAAVSGIEKIIATIWYSVQISKSDHDVLQEALRTLCSTSDESILQLTNGLVDMPANQVEALRQVWQRWASMEGACDKPGNISLHKERRKVRGHLDQVTHYRDDIPLDQKPSYKKWCFDGIFTESIMEVEQLPYYNPTLTGHKGRDEFYTQNEADPPLPKSQLMKPMTPEDHQFGYSSMAKSEPFIAWDYESVRKFGRDQSFPVMYHAYLSHVIGKVIHVIKTGRICIHMTTEEFHQLKQAAVYDRVFTSTLADYYGVYPLLESLAPFLNRDNKHAVMVLGTFALQDDAEEYVYNIAEIERRDAKLMQMSFTELFSLEYPWPLAWDTAPLDYHYDWQWFMRFLKSVHMAIHQSSTVPTSKAVLRCGDLRMRDVRVELNKVVPYRYLWGVREGAPPIKGLRHMEWFWPS